VTERDRTAELGQALLRLSAQKLWSEGRVNPLHLSVGTWIGCFQSDDRRTWRSTDGVWLAELERSSSGGHVSLAFFCRGTYVGRFDERGWHAPRAGRRPHRPRATARSLPLPLAS
jgi:hypothetical protein